MLHFVDHARRVGVHVPRDVSVIGCDGVLEGLSYMELASLRIPVELVSRRAVEVIASMLESPGEVEIMHESYTGTLELANSLVKREAGSEERRGGKEGRIKGQGKPCETY